MASAELLKMTRSVDGKVMSVDDRVKGVEGKVQDVRGDVQDVRSVVQDVHDDVQDVRDGVQDVRGDVQDVGNDVKCVDDMVQGIRSDVNVISSDVRGVNLKLDQVNRSLSRKQLLIIPWTLTTSQGTKSEIVFYDGFRPQIHQSVITLPAKLITPVQPNGFFKAVYLINGNPPIPSCGYMENVRYP